MRASGRPWRMRGWRFNIHRSSDTPLDVAVVGYSAAGDLHVAEEYRQAGATWWLELIHDLRGGLDTLTERILAGPPKR